jgi:sodium-coupled monocarboxylate transporter 8/12
VATVCTISSTLNSLSGVIYKDFISQFSKRQFTEKSAVFILKLIVVIEGVLCTSLVLLIEHLGQTFPLSVSLSGIINGPLLGLFTLGVLFPKINAKVFIKHHIDNMFFFLNFRVLSMEEFVD